MRILLSLAERGLVLGFLLVASGAAQAGSYDPLAVDPAFHPVPKDLTVQDAARHRDIPIRIYLPTNSAPAPVVLFSHGQGGSREGSPFMGGHWAARGYVAVFLQHPGSDESVWKAVPVAQRKQAMETADSAKNLMLRVRDVHAVLNQLERWNADKTNDLAGRLDLEKVGMSGHSFGAVTTEAVSGETFPVVGHRLTDPRIKAALAFSPSVPKGGDPAKAFGAVSIPWMLMTGTKDEGFINKTDPKSRLGVYPALRGAPKYELVLFNAEHSVFTDRPLPGDRAARNPNHHRVILALSTAFWDAYLRNDAEARAWLNGAGPRAVMDAQDQWQFSLP